MRFFADEHIARSIIASVMADGHDVVAVADVSAGATDAEILAMAIADGRGIITFDSDYGDLVFHAGLTPPDTIVYVRMDPRMPLLIAERLVAVLRLLPAGGRMVVVEKERVRTRDFPLYKGIERG